VTDKKAPPPNFSNAAKDFMGLWQQNMEAMAKDPAMMQMATPFLQQFFSLNSSNDSTEPSAQSTAQSGTTPTGTEPDARDELLHQLSRRVEELEHRLANLESKTNDKV